MSRAIYAPSVDRVKPSDSLCETDKYLRLLYGEGKSKRRYDGGGPVVAPNAEGRSEPRTGRRSRNAFIASGKIMSRIRRES